MKGFKKRKFQKGDLVVIDSKKIKKATKRVRVLNAHGKKYGWKYKGKVPYTALVGQVGTVKDYRMRESRGQVWGSTYTVDFPGKGTRKVETEYLTGVKLLK
jgi:hypothetical protein